MLPIFVSAHSCPSQKNHSRQTHDKKPWSKAFEYYGKDTGDYVNAGKDAIATMAAAIPEITIKDEENEFDSIEFIGEYAKIYRDAVEYTTPIIKAINGLPVYYRYHIKNGLAIGKGLEIVRYQDFTKKRNQSQKRKEEKRKEIKKIRRRM